MAKMVAYINGSQLNSRQNKNGSFRKNAKIGINVDYDLIVRRVYQMVKKGEGKPEKTSAKMNEDGQDASKANKSKKSSWKTSSSGLGMLTTQLVSAGYRNYEAYASTDSAEQAMTSFTTAKGTSMLLLSTFGGSVGRISAILLNRLDGMVGQYFKNQIQLKFDNARLDYNYTTLDYGRYSTYVYDDERSTWVAKDTEKIKRNVLNQTS